MATTTKKTTTKKSDTDLKKSEALKKIVEHNRDYLKLDLTLPLGDECLKEVHTNQWLFTDLPKEFDLVNWTVIAKALNSNVNRWEGYVENRWYIESVDISVDAGGKAEMKLGLNAFASNYNSYSDAFKSFEKAYTDATSNNTGTTTSAAKNTTNAVTTGTNNTIKSGWWGKWIEKWVRETVGNETDPLKKAKKIYETFRNHVFYSYYCCALKTKQGNVNSYESAYKNAHLNCGDGANILCAAYNCAGVKSTIMHTTNHFIVRSTINGVNYWTDCAGASGHHDNHGWNQVYGYKGGSPLGNKVTCAGYYC